MSEVFDDAGMLIQENLPTVLGDDYYNDPETKQQPTKLFENVKDEKTFMKNYVNAQRTISKGEAAFVEKTKGMIKVPGEGAKPEEIAAYNKAIGVPESADKYELAIPKDDTNGFAVIADEVKAAAIEAGIPKGALEKVWGKVIATLTKQAADLEAKGLAMIKADEEALKGELKEKYDEFIKAGDGVLNKLKVGAEVTKIFDAYKLKNHSAIRKMLAEIAPLVLEGQSHGSSGGINTPSGDGWPITYKYDPTTGKPIG